MDWSAFVHSTEHGLSEIHEPPRLGKRDRTCSPGMAITIEPGVYLKASAASALGYGRGDPKRLRGPDAHPGVAPPIAVSWC